MCLLIMTLIFLSNIKPFKKKTVFFSHRKGSDKANVGGVCSLRSHPSLSIVYNIQVHKAFINLQSLNLNNKIVIHTHLWVF